MFVGGKRRNLGLVLLAAAIVVAVVLVLYAVGRLPEQPRNDWATYLGFGLGLVVPAAGWIAWLLRQRRKQDSGALVGRELDHLADQLAKAVKEQWEDAAGERGLLEPKPIPVHWRMPSEAMAGPVDTAVGSTRFSPLPGLCLIEPQDLQKGTISDLYAVYGGLGSGRLVIAGAPGSGKSGAAVLLILAALEHRRHVPKKARSQVPVPVPVMFTLQGWDPSTQDAKKWLAERISQTYPLFAGKDGLAAASDLLAEGRIAVILDGLDEIPRDLRPAVLRALSSQATFRLVLLTRSAEMAAAAGEVLLQGAAAIELQDIPDKTAASYLESVQLAPPPQGWSELISHLRQKQPSPLKDALNNPLMLTLLRDTYHQEDDVSELLRLRSPAGHPASAQDITCHFLDRVLRAAYSQRPGEPPPRYDLPTASRTLGHIAVWMNKDGTRDLRWWQIPTWASVAPRVVITGLLAAVPTGILLSFANNWLIGILPPLGIGLVVGRVAGAGNRVPKRINRLTWRQILQRKALKAGFRAGSRVGLVTGLLAALIIVLPNWRHLGPMWAVVYGLLATLLAGLVVTPIASLPLWLLTSASLPSIEDTSPLSPLTTWRRDRSFGRLAGVVIGLTILITLTFISWSTGPRNAVLSGLGLALIVGIPVWLTYPQAWPSSLAFAQLAISNKTPVRLMRFLEDAHERGVLRTVGPVYQFRHASLQDSLAEQTSPLSWKPEYIHRQKSLVSEFDQLVDMLAISVQDRWLRVSKEHRLLKAEPIPVRWTKSSLPLAEPVSAAVHSTLFPPLPGLKAVAEQQLQAGQIVDLVQVFGGLRSGRLLIAGASGSGKTGTAVLLALMILIHREHVPDDDRPDVPVPVSFTLHGWDPRTQKVQDWLSLQLQQNYPLFIQKKGFAKAAELLGKGKIAVILDGLDEIPEDLRPVALRALSRQAHFRMVILTQSAEMAAAATNGLLDGAAAIELQDIDHATAADYLARIQPNPAPKGWDDLVDHLRQTPDSSITQALNSPLALTLVRDTYRSSDDVSELLKISDATDRQVPARDIVDYLLDRVLPAAYKQVPGDPAPRYKLQTSQMTLSRIAALMNRDSTYDLQWWRVKKWLPVTPRAISTGLIFGLVPAMLSGLANFTYWFTYALGNGYGNTKEYRFLQQHELQYWLLAYGFTVWLLYGLGAGLVVALPRMVSFLTPKKGFLVFYWLLREFPFDPSTARHMRAYALGLELMMAFGAGMTSLIPFGYVFLTAQEVALWVLAVFGVIMIVFGFLSALIGATLFTEAFNTLMASLAFAQLHLRWHTPIRLMPFLEDARRRGVIRKSGYVYQLRHARLQDRLAKQTSFSRK